MDILKRLDMTDCEVNTICFIDVPTEYTEEFIKNNQGFSYVTNTSVNDSMNISYNIDIPAVFANVESRIQYVLDTLLDEHVVEPGEDVLIVIKLPILDEINFISVKAQNSPLNTSIRDLFIESQPDKKTIHDTLNVATSLSETGQKGEPIGVLFIVGDEDAVLDRSRPLNHNPFTGANVQIGDDVVAASIGEFAKLDGAFVISDTGSVISANRYLEPRVYDAEVPSGLGARHMAASGITKATDAVGIVVSETDQKVRCFVDGEIVLEASPDEMRLLS